ncbi:desmoglein-2-like [Xyrauchen texanus]|uniref:desmoglein-2-like n=1 Tax=Xyrauchen texanus TaxID=154827 RepID=UPI002241EDE8|nr:desmoglein-2-like [Xyrauchen texanus]
MARRMSPAVAFLFCFGLSHVFEVEGRFQHSVALHRQKREWIIPPQILEENVDYTKKEFIAKIRSDKDDFQGKNVRYSLKGIGADREPFNLFVVNPETGYVRITGLLDREKIQQYNLTGLATFSDGQIAENEIGLRIKVKDQNDNPPIFGPLVTGSVDELSPPGTQVMKIDCSDADEPGNPNSQIKYEIVGQQPEGQQMFTVNSEGIVSVKSANLDRETVDQYIVLVKASDLNGAPGGNAVTGTVTVKINDVNDNVPILEGPFEGSIEENTQNVEVMRFKATDFDLENTDNWVAKCNIVSGNEAGYFSIHTDDKTNEVILMLDKSVDYEDIKDLNLGIGIENNAPFHSSVTGGNQGINVDGGGGGGGGGGGFSSSGGGAMTWLSSSPIYHVIVKVKNQPEGPKFIPQTKAIPISEDSKTFNKNEIIARYPAIDTDTGKEATNVRYAKGYDPDNWLTIDEKTGAIKMNKVPDRESKHLVNGTYIAKIFSITNDMPSKTATGTIAIQVEDFNDHCPTLSSQVQTLCTDKDAVFVTAVDEDAPPNGAPFTFSVPEDTKGKWTIEHFNDTTAIFRAHEKLWPGKYELSVEVKDQQGLACPEKQKLPVEVCTCTDQGACSRTGTDGVKKSSKFGPAGIGLLFLGILALLLIPLLLLLCQCGAAGMAGRFTEMPFDTKEHLIAYHTEGQGEDRDVPLLASEVDGQNGYGIKGGASASHGVLAMQGGGSMYGGGFMYGGASCFQESTSTVVGRGYNEMEINHMDSMARQMNGNFVSREMGDNFDGMALSDVFLDEFYSQKSRGMDDGFAKNNALVYDYEGKGSPVGSVGCCSLLEDNDDLAFLNDLGPKFTTLAKICGGKTVTTVESAPLLLPPPPKPVVETMTTSTNIVNSGNFATNSVVSSNTVNMAPNVASSSSTHVENVLITASRPAMTANVQPAQTLLVQQQPMYYMIEPQQSTVVLAERPTMGLGQSMYVLNNGNMAANTMNRGERMVVLDSVGSSQALNHGMLHTSNMSGSQVLMVDGGSQSNQLLQGTFQRGIVGSQGLMVMEGQGGQMIQGSLRRGVSTHGGSQGVIYVENKGGSGVVQGSPQKGFASTSGSIHGNIESSGASVLLNQNASQKVVVQERKVVTSQSIK